MTWTHRAAALTVGALLVAPLAFGQSQHSFTHGESKRCASFSGDAKDQCDKEEATKTQGAAAREAAGNGSQSAAGASSAVSEPKAFTHGESKRCESLTGAAKAQCDEEEATKTEGPSAREASK